MTTTPMRQYTLKVKGYRTSAALAKIYVQSVGSVSGSLVEPGPVLPTAEGWISVTFTAPSTATYIKVGVLLYSPAVGDQFFLNRMELYEYNGGQGNMVFAQNGNFTYQYHLKDHLGNVRLTFTTKDEKDISKATMETANSNTEQGQFLYYDEAVKVNSTIFDHTDAGPTWYSTRLNGSTNERFGLAKSLSVMPGDTVRAEVYAKYLDPNSSNWTAALNSLITSIGNGTAPGGTFIDGGLPGSTGGVAIPYAGASDKASETGSAPKAYLNYIVFDRDFNLKDGGYVRVTTAGREYGQDAPHEKLAKELVITEPGYVYLYISNDNVSLGGGQVEVYFDDFKVEQVKSPVVQSQDYYPFGLRFNSYNRENHLMDRTKLFQDQEHVDDLGLNWDSFKWRNHMPDIGRFFNVDPLSEKYIHNSAYAFSENKVISYRELEGLEANLAIYAINQDIIKNKNAIAPNVPMNGTKQPSMGSRIWSGIVSVTKSLGGFWSALGNALEGWAPKKGGGFVVTGPNSLGTTGPTRQGTSSGELDATPLLQGPPTSRSSSNKNYEKFIDGMNGVFKLESETHSIENTVVPNPNTNSEHTEDATGKQTPTLIGDEYCSVCTKPGDTINVTQQNKAQHDIPGTIKSRTGDKKQDVNN